MEAFALTGRNYHLYIIPRVLPWARSFCPFRAYGVSKSTSSLGVPTDLQSGETPSGLPRLRKFSPLLLRNNLEDFCRAFYLKLGSLLHQFHLAE